MGAETQDYPPKIKKEDARQNGNFGRGWGVCRRPDAGADTLKCGTPIYCVGCEGADAWHIIPFIEKYVVTPFPSSKPPIDM